MTRTGRSPRLAVHRPEPFVEVHPQDAAAMRLSDQGFAEIATAHGRCVVKVLVSEQQRAGLLFMPIHWSAETCSNACAGDLVAPHTDPHSGQPEAKATPATIAPIDYPLRGFARMPPSPPQTGAGEPMFPDGTWWTRVALPDGIEYRLASRQGPMFWHDFAYRRLGSQASLAEQFDGQVYRAAAFLDDRLEGCLGIGPSQTSLQWSPLNLAPQEPAAEDNPRILKSWDSGYYMSETAAVVCACFQVGIDAVRNAVACGESRSVEDIGRKLGAGTNCGSCLPELKRIVAHERIAHPH
jgi:assimilatory nitrate reductase catalytic subunit